MDGNPREDQPKEDNSEDDDLKEARLLSKQKQPKDDQQEYGNPNQGILIQEPVQWLILKYIGTHFDNLCDFP